LELDEILDSVKAGKVSSAKARKLLSLYSIQKIEDFAQIDIDRKKRRGIPEVVFAQDKQLSEIKKIIQTVLKKNQILFWFHA